MFPLPEEDGAQTLLVAVARPARSIRLAPPAANSLLNSVSDAILAVDGFGIVTSANPSAGRLLGMPLAELRGLPLALLAYGADDLESLLHAAGREDPTEVELTLRRKDGASVRAAAALAPHRQTDGSLDGSAIALRVVTEQRVEAADLARKNQELEHCVNTLAHDLRSPLVAMLGFSRLLRQDYGEHLDDTGLHFVDRIEQSGRTMESLIHDLLELSRIGQPGERRTMVDPRTVLLQIAAEFKPNLDSYGIRLTLPEHPPLVYCDRTRLYQVFSNLIDNAIHHMGECEDPSIRVEIVEENEQAHHISVRDSGRGVAPEQQERIFEVFQSLGSRRDGARGTGIGLAIVRKIAETHDGRAWVESQPGHGAVFHVTLPRP
jgi:PAS domain S-box-containing protein